MPEILSPGVYIEEVPETTTVTPSASTSNAAFVGFTDKGPSQDPTLVTTFAEYLQTFGGYRAESYMTYAVQGFFANGGRRAYIVRVPPADAVSADGQIRLDVVNQAAEIGDGTTTTFTKTSGTTPLYVNGGDAAVVDGATVTWRIAGTPVTASALKKRDGTTNLVGVTAQTSYEGRINPAALQTVAAPLWSVVAGSVTLNWEVSASPVTKAITAPTSGSITTLGAGGGIDSLVFDHITGFISVDFTTAPDNNSAITLDFTPTSATRTATDSGGTFTGSGLTSGTITHSTGAYNLVFATAPANKSPILFNYETVDFGVTAKSAGAWGNSVKVRVVGNADSYDNTTVSYSLHDVSVLVLNSETSAYEVQEFYEGVSLTDSASAVYMPDVLNDLSDLVVITEPGGDYALAQLAGTSKSEVIAGGNELAGSATVSATLAGAPVQPRTVTITYTNASGTSKTITDDGVGGLSGDVDATVSATINYTTGAVSFKCASGDTIKGGTFVVATYYAAASATSASWVLGDSTLGFTAGEDGTFDSTNYGRNQISAPSLEAGLDGIYALNSVEELMQVVIPDFVSNVTVSKDLMDYCDGRLNQAAGPDRFAILAVPAGYDDTEATDWVQFQLQQFSKLAAIYWPHVRVADPLANGRSKTVPPMGHIAGIYARTDNNRNVSKAPGGTVDGQINGITGLELVSTKGQRDAVYQKRINPLISSTNTGNAVWGVRTLSNQTAWRTVNVPRLFMFVERSVYNSTQWTVFESNGPGLWNRISSQLNSFLGQLYREGYFAGTTPTEAFSVICDSTNNTQETINNGQVIIDVAIAPTRPSEFVRMRFAQKTIS